MAYLTIPNTFASQTTGIATLVISNYVAVIQALSSASVDNKIYNASYTGTVSVVGTMSCSTGVNFQGDVVGARYVIELNRGAANLSSIPVYALPGAKLGTVSAPQEGGIIMPRAGSVVGLSTKFVNHLTASTIGLQVQVRKNGSAVASSSVFTLTTSANTSFSEVVSFTRGVKSFAAGDRLAGYIHIVNTSAVQFTDLEYAVMLDVQVDS